MSKELDLGQEVLRGMDVQKRLRELEAQAVALPPDATEVAFTQEESHAEESDEEEPAKEESPPKLTVEAIEEMDKKEYDEWFDVKLSSGHVISLKKKFRPTEIQKMGDELIVGMNRFAEHDISITALAVPYIMLLTIKYFSDLDVPDDFERQVAVMNMLLDSNLLGEIFNSFDKEQRDLLDKHLVSFTEGVRAVATGLGAETAKVEEAITKSEE
jgi:hypothetical protein